MDIFSTSTIAMIGCALGTTSHWAYFIHGEHHMSSIRFFWASFLLPALTYIVVLRHVDYSYLVAAKITFAATGSYVASLLTSIGIYRAFFHRLHHFQGPLALKISKLSHVAMIGNESRNFALLDRLHKKYGQYVRIGPNDISIIDPKAVSAILGAGSKCTKVAWYDAVAYPDKALNMERDRATHDARRKVWDRGFSAKALRDYEGRVKSCTDQLMSQLNARSGKAIDASQWFNFYAFDMMSWMAFGESFDMLRTGETHPVIKIMQDGMAPVGLLSPISWIFPIFKTVPGLGNPTKAFIKHNSDHVEKRKQYTPDLPDLFGWLIDAEKQSPDPIHKDPRWLVGDCGLIIVAGSDTTTATLAYIFYHLVKSPGSLEKLRQELHSFYQPGADSEFKELESAPYLNGCINEALRLHPPTPSGLQRNTPPEGITIGSTYIPGDVTVSTPFWSIGRLETCYKNAEEFIPERWDKKSEMVIDKSVFAPFSLGAFGCVGKQLALMEIRNVTARIVSQFDVKFAAGEDGRGLIEDSKDTFTINIAPLMLEFTRREV